MKKEDTVQIDTTTVEMKIPTELWDQVKNKCHEITGIEGVRHSYRRAAIDALREWVARKN